ncbi:MAG TPA: DUF3175 domain-containing protein [Gammaproteobacteria bacterium]|jgi:hypothetical protein|nr:DUF3175 domain-containing protein [Gammaproteobacteria bacterium]
MAAHKKAQSRPPAHHSVGSRPRRSSTRKKTSRSGKRYWSGKVTRESHAMDLKQGVFTGSDPNKIARSVLASARRSHTRKTTPYRSAMSMINFYINRGGAGLSAAKKRVLERAKDALRRQAGKEKKPRH